MKAHILTLIMALVKADINCEIKNGGFDTRDECETEVRNICEDQSFANLFFYILYAGSIIYLIIDYIRDYR